MTAAWLRGLAVALCACSTDAPLPAVRFVNAPAVAAVNDRRDVATPPAPRTFLLGVYNFDAAIERRITRALELPRTERARGVNALDEVPDSTWFTNRIGIRELAPDEVRTGPLTVDSPELHRPWTVKSTKVGGASIGFVITDRRGIKYLLKFDSPDDPELETGNDVIVNRLLWAAGYNVAEDQIVYFRDGDLLLAPDAAIKDERGERLGPVDRAGLERKLAQVAHGDDGQIRGVVSRWIEGKTLGGFPTEGVRRDDPNDVIPHQLRRDLRGAYPIFAWVDHVDLHEGNFVDTWVTDASDPRRHYVRHYLVDFGKSLGAMAWFGLDWRRGYTYVLDFAEIARTLVTLGMLDRPWHHRALAPARHVGSFDATSFDPGDWHSDWPTFVPFLTADRIDKFWGAKIVARFTRPQIAAAVDAARLHDPVAASYLIETLIGRQRATVAYWFTRVNPLDRFSISIEDGAPRLCFEDLAITYAVADGATTRYTIAAYDGDARPIGQTTAAATGRRTCARVLLVGEADGRGYTIVRVATARPGFFGETDVHVAPAPGSRLPRVIGVWRP